MGKIMEMLHREAKVIEDSQAALKLMQPIDCMIVIRFKKKDQGYHTHYVFPQVDVANDMFIGIGEKLREEKERKGGLVLPKSWMDGA